MVIIGFVVTVMIFSSFAIVFSNSGNNLNTSNKQILNLPEKSLTSTVVNKVQIDLSNLPSGNGYYQQLITLNNYDTYGINSNGSNIEFFSSNNTQLYAWIQSINSTSMHVWVKNYNDSNTIDMQVLPSSENDFSENGYLGKANTTTDNGWKVFPIYFSPYSLEDGLSETYNEPSSTYSVSTYDGTKTLNVTGLLMSNITLQNSGKYAVVSDYYGTAAYGQFGLLYNTDTTNLGGYAVFVNSNSGSGSYFQVQTMNNSYGGSPQYGSPNSLLRTTYLVYNGTGSSSIYGGVGTTPLVAVGQNLVYSATLSLATGDLQSEGNVPMHLAFSTFGGLQTSYIMYSFVYDYIGNMPTYTINQILNLQSGINKTVITLSNPKIDINTPLEFYDNFMLSVNNNNNFIIENLTNGQILVTNLTYNTVCGSNYYGIIINSSILYVYLENNAVKEPYIYIYGYSTSNLNIISDSRLDSSIFNSSGVSQYYTLTNFGITANTNGIYAFFIGNFVSPNSVNPLILHINYNGHIEEQKRYEYNIYTNSKESGYTMGNFFFFNSSLIGFFVNLNNFNINTFSGNSYYGEMIYNNTYQNIFTLSYNLNYYNTYNSNMISYGCIYNDYKFTVNSEPKIFNNFRTGTQLGISLSFINANYYNNVFINSNNQLEYNNINVSLGFYTLPYTIINNSLYYAINSYSYGIINLISYKLNITSYNHNSNPLKDYFYYNNNIYYGNTYSFTNDNGIFSILPLNYSVYVYNGSYITTSSSEFKSVGNGIYQYNLSIYYGQLTTNTTSSIKPLDISSYIYPIGIIIFVSFLGAMVYFSKSEGKK